MSEQKSSGRIEKKQIVDRTALFELFQTTNPKSGQEVLCRRVQPEALKAIDKSQFKTTVSMLLKVSADGVLSVKKVKATGGSYVAIVGNSQGNSIHEELEEGRGSRELIAKLRRVAQALDQLHGQGHIHGDIRPATVFYDNDGQLNLSDFAFHHALLGWSEHSHLLTKDSAPKIVRAPWTAPEVRRGGEITPQCDQYALAAILGAIVLGRVPKPDESLAELLNNSGDDAGSDRMLTCAALSTALSEDPTLRYVTCTSMIDEVLKALNDKSVGRSQRGKRGNGLMWQAATIAALFLAVPAYPFVADFLRVSDEKYVQQQKITDDWQTDVPAFSRPKLLTQVTGIVGNESSLVSSINIERDKRADRLKEDKSNERQAGIQQKKEREKQEFDKFERNASFDANSSSLSLPRLEANDRNFLLVDSSGRVQRANNLGRLSWNLNLSFRKTPPNQAVNAQVQLISDSGIAKASQEFQIKAGDSSASVVVGLDSPKSGESFRLQFSWRKPSTSQWNDWKVVKADQARLSVTVVELAGNSAAVPLNPSLVRLDMLNDNGIKTSTRLAPGNVFWMNVDGTITPGTKQLYEDFGKSLQPIGPAGISVSSQPPLKRLHLQNMNWGTAVFKLNDGWQRITNGVQVANRGGAIHLGINLLTKRIDRGKVDDMDRNFVNSQRRIFTIDSPGQFVVTIGTGKVSHPRGVDIGRRQDYLNEISKQINGLGGSR